MNVLMVLVLFVLVFASVWYVMSLPLRELPLPKEPTPKVAEIPPLDPMVVCPQCKLMGYHSLDFERARPAAPIARIETLDGEVEEVYTWQSAAGISAHYRRKCVFCTHAWSVPVGAG